MRIIVAGAGASGLKVLQAVTDSSDTSVGEHEIVGFIDDNVNLKGSDFYGYPMLGSTSELDEIEDRVGPLKTIGLVCVISEPQIRQNVLERIAHRFELFPNIAHPSAQVSKFATVGKGNLFSQNVIIQGGTTVNDFNVFDAGVVVGTSVAITDYCTLNANAVIACYSKLEALTSVGSGSTVINNAVIGSHSTVAPNSFVTRSLEDGSTVLGVPAKKMR